MLTLVVAEANGSSDMLFYLKNGSMSLWILTIHCLFSFLIFGSREIIMIG